MATAILTHGGRSAAQPGSIPETLWAMWRVRRRQAAERAALARAARLGPRLIADMGLEAEEARALVGDWDALFPNGYLVRPVR